MTFEGLVEAIQKTGMATEGLSDEQILSVGRALNLELPLRVSVVEYTDKRGRTANYVKTDNFPIGTDGDGKQVTARGLFLRVEAIDQAIESLHAAKAQLSGDEHDGEG